ncbi:MAG: polysaccharide deacetylase family protein [Prevotellaceae bacterium]|jgi:peptidoglycan/xylan/chitin deacetylase (PgdA/CDA1 family)|nr:polysaccharide deacetylase family protein [Prevotellaceae bacterium]
MKIRYMLLTLIVAGAVGAGAGWLLTEMEQAVGHLLHSRPTVSATPQQPQATPATALSIPDSTTQTPAPDSLRHATDTSKAASLPDAPDEAFGEAALQRVVTRYASVRPQYWNDKQVKGAVVKVNAPQSGERLLFLTFNAYTNDYPALFDLLAQRQIKATFFLSGVWVRRNAAQAQKIGRQHSIFEIENHGNRNIPLSSRGAEAYQHAGTPTLERALRDALDGRDAVEQATGQKPRYIRPFLNYTDDVVVQALSDLQIKTVGATIFADGGGMSGSEKIKTNILTAPHGSILLFNVDAAYPNVLNGLQAAFETIAETSLPLRFAFLSDYERYFEYGN